MFDIKKMLGFEFYSSELDDFLAALDKKYRLSESQEFEKKKYDRIYRLRDANRQAPTDTTPIKLWDEF